jgi:hypothetical protein
MDWRCSEPALQAGSPEFKPQFHQKERWKLRRGEGVTGIIHGLENEGRVHEPTNIGSL